MNLQQAAHSSSGIRSTSKGQTAPGVERTRNKWTPHCSQGATSLLRVGAARGTNKYKYKAGFESTEKVKKVIILMGERIKDCFR